MLLENETSADLETPREVAEGRVAREELLENGRLDPCTQNREHGLLRVSNERFDIFLGHARRCKDAVEFGHLTDRKCMKAGHF